MLPQAEKLSMHFTSHESPHNYLYAELFAISYTALNGSDSYSAPSSPHLFSQLAIMIPATITAMHSAMVHPSPNVPKDIKLDLELLPPYLRFWLFLLCGDTFIICYM